MDAGSKIRQHSGVDGSHIVSVFAQRVTPKVEPKYPGGVQPAPGDMQAIAWLQLAADQGIMDAKAVLDREEAKITPEQTAWAKSLKPKLLQQLRQGRLDKGITLILS